MLKVAQNFDCFSDGYDYWKRITYDPLHYQFIIDNIPENCNHLLDVGCGTGRLSIMLSKYSKFVTGIDNSKAMITRAFENKSKEAKTNVEFVLTDIENFDFSKTQYDIIFSFYTLHHTDLSITLQKLKNALSKGGQIFIKDLLCKDTHKWQTSKLFHIFRAIKGSKQLLLKHGIIPTIKIFKFRISSSWIQHLMKDQVLTEEETRKICEIVLPGSIFTANNFEYSLYYKVPTLKL